MFQFGVRKVCFKGASSAFTIDWGFLEAEREVKLYLDGTNEGERRLQRTGNYPTPFSSQATKAQAAILLYTWTSPMLGVKFVYRKLPKI